MNQTVTYIIMSVVLVSGLSLMAYQRLHPPEIVNLPTTIPSLPTSTLETFLTLSTSTTPTPATTSTPAETVSVAEIVAAADRYDNQTICLRGSYQKSFEFSAYGGSFNTDDNLMKPWIWVEADVDESQLHCQQTEFDQTICRGTITTCGIFRFADTGEPGFGHVNAYRYKLE